VSFINEPDQSHIQLGHYRFTSIAAVEERLARYPRGTAFTLQRGPIESSEIAAAIARLITFAGSQGLSIKER